MTHQYKTMDGCSAVSHIAYRVNEVAAIYPITPSSPMAELADQFAAEKQRNIWGDVPNIIEMQSEAGAAGATHGSLQTGALTTTFTASQGLLLMIPNMYKIAGELTSTVFHVAARSLATGALSIFGDHQDVMACNQTGFAMLASSSVQQAHDNALIAQVATLASRVPFIHFFDGFRTSHEVNKIDVMSDDIIREMINNDDVIAHRKRGLAPERAFIRGTAQNPDIYFQGREAVNPYYQAVPNIVNDAMVKFAQLTDREYQPFSYYGDPEATSVMVIMGSGAQTAHLTVDELNKNGKSVGLIEVHLYRPFAVDYFTNVLPESCHHLIVMDRCKTPGAVAEPLYTDVMSALVEQCSVGKRICLPKMTGGRYGLSSKQFTPAMVKAAFDNAIAEKPISQFTVGINDDVSFTSLAIDNNYTLEPDNTVRAVIYGWGSDGSVGATKSTIKIIGAKDNKFVQGYYDYDSKKAGSRTVSHLRFGDAPIEAPWMIEQASFVGINQFNFLTKFDCLVNAEKGATVLLNSPYDAEHVWEHLPLTVQQQIIDKELSLYVLDAMKVAAETNMGRRINTIMQTGFFMLANVFEQQEAIEQIKHSIEVAYSRKGQAVVEMNWNAVDHAVSATQKVTIPATATSNVEVKSTIGDDQPQFLQKVTKEVMAMRGDLIPVSEIPCDGTFPSGTTRFDKHRQAVNVPSWDPELCIQCGNCSFICPHATIRSKIYNKDELAAAPENFKYTDVSARGFPDTAYTIQVYAEDCMGCTLCVDACPAHSATDSNRKALQMVPAAEQWDEQAPNVEFFESLPQLPINQVDYSTVKGVQFLPPHFQFPASCASCGETAVLKVISQLFGERLMIANATGCSSIYGGNMPTTPWTQGKNGYGPAWSNSLFEDNAEFGLGYRISVDHQKDMASRLIKELESEIGHELVQAVLTAEQSTEQACLEQRERVETIREKLIGHPKSAELDSVIDTLVERSIWIVGGDGWAYDIGSGGLDHALGSSRNINVLVMDTEVYSNTGGQASKATPLAATAKFAAGGKPTFRKELGLQAISYGNVYVAQICLNANPQQALQALREAEAYDGPSLILSYSPCIAHGFDMTQARQQAKKAVYSGHWPLYRYNPMLKEQGENPFTLDSLRPTISKAEFMQQESRFNQLFKTNPEHAVELFDRAQAVALKKWSVFEEMAETDAAWFEPELSSVVPAKNN
ncbi:pyruvate:ferredoxin (flavodoxin) oxidoreductase [Photobacterium leiognathi]|uniref:pyruvate:ferredoxin (flavodoxin) oxidoreductase n=1 Tax=Photobacterium leiognathi TaxID=553611 RepID=UPI001EDF7C31|nr:pyruvate:ferredoxin (flavodoxin) oxidoreductase [Photobacterium leiognathi]MCG3887033.1 pyruvate:ferredoxin (flavodoxin) oxidoreductase [Photobacterium leiognathi]